MGASKQKLLLGVGLPFKILFLRGLTQTWGPQGPPYQMGMYAFRIGRGQQTKIAPLGGFVYEIFICGGLTPTQKPAGSVDQSAGTFSGTLGKLNEPQCSKTES